VVDDVRVEAGSWKIELAKPESLNLAKAYSIAEVDVQPKRDSVVGYLKALPEKSQKKTAHVRVGVREHEAVPVLRSLGPVEHAPGLMERVAPPCFLAPLFLKCQTSLTISVGPHGTAHTSRLFKVSRRMFGLDFDVSGPVVNAR
jgi:hypothetical protein